MQAQASLHVNVAVTDPLVFIHKKGNLGKLQMEPKICHEMAAHERFMDHTPAVFIFLWCCSVTEEHLYLSGFSAGLKR